MSKKPNLYLVNSPSEIQHDFRKIRHLAESLCLIFKINYGTEFILLLGDGSEVNNRQALETWVNRNLDDHYEQSTAKILEYLVEFLGQELENWDSNRWG